MIEFHEIRKVFQEKIALDDISFEINSGQIFGIIGPNGAGKTTLIRILTQILSPSGGTIKINGVSLNNSHVSLFGYLPEERGLYREMKVKDHLVFLGQLKGLSAKDAKKSTLEWLDKFEIHDWSEKRINLLSKGMAQKVQFIGSILHNPEYIILDEPLSGFDPLNIQLILNEINLFKKNGKTVIFSTHNMDSVDTICDEVAIFHKGKVIAKDNVVDLRTQYRNGDYKIRYKGNNIALANALWTGFELLESKELNSDVREAIIRKRGDLTFNDVFSYLSNNVELEMIEEQMPGMQDVFIKLVNEKESHEE